MKKLQLPLKTKWFEMTEAGVKKEDYRIVTAYWAARLMLVNGEIKNQKWWLKNHLFLLEKEYLKRTFENEFHGFSFRSFDINRMTLGYPSATDKDRILELEHKGIEIREGNPELGAEPGVLYFCILHGDIIQN